MTCRRSMACATSFSPSPSFSPRHCYSLSRAQRPSSNSPARGIWIRTEASGSGSSLSAAPIREASSTMSCITHRTWPAGGGLCWTSLEWVRFVFANMAKGPCAHADEPVTVANFPSKTQLLTLDLLIICLQFILLCIAYETSLSLVMPPETPDPLLPYDSTSGMHLSTATSLAYRSHYGVR